MNSRIFHVLGLCLALTLASTPVRSADVTVAAPWEVASVDPAISGFALQRMQVMETLVDVDSTGNLTPGLATEWTASDDGLTWEFTLRSGVRFHDDSVLNPEAATAALRRAVEQPGILKKAPITSVDASASGVVIKLERPFAALPSMLAHSTTVIPAPGSFDAAGAPTKAIGTGPFRVETFSPPQSLDVVRFDAYWGEAPAIASAKYLSSSRAETRALLAESGDADLVFTLDPSGYARLKSVDSVEAVAVPIPRVVTLKVNSGHPFLSTGARQALSMAIDREGIAAGITRFPEAAATQLFPPALGNWHRKSMKPLAFDPAAAKAMLQKEGWAPGADGVLERNGERFSILLRTFPDRPELPLIAAALQDQWRAIGVELEVSVANYSEIPAGHKDGTLHVALYARNYGLTPDPIGTVLADFGKGGGDWGSMNWDRADVASALQSIAETTDKATRDPMIEKAAAAIHAELPLIPIVWYQHTVSIGKRLKGVQVDPLERSYGLSRATLAQ